MRDKSMFPWYRTPASQLAERVKYGGRKGRRARQRLLSIGRARVRSIQRMSPKEREGQRLTRKDMDRLAEALLGFGGLYFLTPRELQNVASTMGKLDHPTLEALIEAAKKAPPMTPEEKEAQRRSFAYGNLQLSGIPVTREDIDRAAEKLDRERAEP